MFISILKTDTTIFVFKQKWDPLYEFSLYARLAFITLATLNEWLCSDLCGVCKDRTSGLSSH